MAKVGVCCMFCWNKDYHFAIRDMLVVNIVAAVLTINWILWSTVAMPPNFSVLKPVIGFVLKGIIFCIQLFVLYATSVHYHKYKNDFVTPRKELFMYGKISTYLGIIKLFCLSGLVALTCILIDMAVDKNNDLTFEKLGAFFVVARVVLAGCIALEVWGLYMMAKLTHITSDEVYDKSIPGKSINMAQNVEKKALKSNSHADLNKVEVGDQNMHHKENTTKINNHIELADSQGMSKTGSERIVNNNEFQQIEVNPNQ
jgi:hypothetical protein